MRRLLEWGLPAAGLLLSGCCLFTDPPPPPPENAARISVEASRSVALEDVWVHQEGDRLVIEGVLHPRSFIQKDAGHVDVYIADAEGTPVRTLKIVPEEAVFQKEQERVSPFSTTLELVIEPDATVEMLAHDGPAAACARIK